MTSGIDIDVLDEVGDVVDRLNAAESFEEASDVLISWAREYSGAEAAVLRLREEDGQGHEWVPVCRSLGANDDFVRDETVVTVDECLCGRVSQGAVDGNMPFVTERGSFVWGRMADLEDEFTAEEVGHLRGRCVVEGFRSVAIFPLGSDEPVGALLLTHRSEDAFGPTTRVLETVSMIAGRVLLKHKTREREKTVLDAIQTALLPPEPPSVPGLELGVCFTSATNIAFVGGDFYDVVDLDGDGVLLLVGDYSGKGIHAAGMAAQARYAVSALARRTRSRLDPASLATEANRILAESLPADRFVSLLACVIHPSNGEVRLVTAGHPPPLLLAEDSGGTSEEPYVPTLGNPPLGVFPDREYQGTSLTMDEDSVLVIYTDGVTDARRDGNLFGARGIVQAWGNTPFRDPGSIAAAVCEASRTHHDSELPPDDRLVLTVRRTAAAARSRPADQR